MTPILWIVIHIVIHSILYILWITFIINATETNLKLLLNSIEFYWQHNQSRLLCVALACFADFVSHNFGHFYTHLRTPALLTGTRIYVLLALFCCGLFCPLRDVLLESGGVLDALPD